MKKKIFLKQEPVKKNGRRDEEGRNKGMKEGKVEGKKKEERTDRHAGYRWSKKEERKRKGQNEMMWEKI